MTENQNELTINNEVYVKKSSINNNAEKLDDMEYVIVRTYSAGVFAGYLKSRKEKEVELVNSRRIWYWEGAASLSQLAENGTSKPDKCKFPCEVSNVVLTECIEILKCSEKSRLSIKSVKIWEQ